LPSVARQITRLARKLKLEDVTPDCLPAFDLTSILDVRSPPHVVAAVPLEPAAWIVRTAPLRERLAGFDAVRFRSARRQ
jgi:hypothetical protein